MIIEKNVPMPRKRAVRSERTNEFDAALRVMEVGDSIAFPASESSVVEHFRHFAQQAYDYKMTRRISEDKQKIRIWRIEL